MSAFILEPSETASESTPSEITKNGRKRRKVIPGAKAKAPAPEARRVPWGPSVEEWLRWLTGSRKPGTVKDSQSRVGILRRWAEAQSPPVLLSDFRARHMAHFLADRQKAGLKDTSRRHDAIVAKSFLKWCYRERHVDEDPLAGFQIPKAQKAFVACPTAPEIEALLAAVADRWNVYKNPGCRFTYEAARRFYSARDMAVLTGLVSTACRIGELLSLRLDDCKLDQRQVTFRETKGGQPRTLPVGDDWKAALEAYLRRRPKCDNPFLFITADGGSFGPDGKHRAIPLTSFENNFHHYQDYAGSRGKWTMHGLRHYALTHMAKQNLLMASAIAGHKDLKTTRTYLHADADWLRDAHTAGDPLKSLKPVMVNTKSSGRRRIL